jgi:hypothetical protein
MPLRLASRRLASRRLASRSVPGAGEPWTDTAPPSGTTLGTMALIATERSIGCDILFTEGAITVTTVTAEFRFETASGRRDALDFWPTRPTSGNKNIYGSILSLVANTTYQIRARVNFSDGSHAYRVGSATTRTITLPDISTPTRWVDPVNGNDSWTGTSATFVSGTTGPWKTYAKFAATYPSGGSVRFLSNGNKVYLTSAGPQLNRGPVKMSTDAPVVDTTLAESDRGVVTEVTSGGRVTIEPGAVTAPSGTVTSDAWVTVAPWVSVSLTGPGNYGTTPGATHQVWRWQNCPLADPTQGSYATTRDGWPQRLACWRRDAVDLSTAEEWAEMVRTNQTYQYGFWSDGAGAGTTTLYARLPTDLDPNTLWLWFGSGNGVWLGNLGSRVSGFSIHTFHAPVYSSNPGGGMVIDRNLLQDGFNHVYLQDANPDCLVQHNLMRDANLWQFTQPAPHVVAWRAIKGDSIMFNGASYGDKILQHSEQTFVALTSGARRAIIRYNTMLQGFNGVQVIGSGANSATRTQGDNVDIHDNWISELSDDAFEPEFSVINNRYWNNRIENTLTWISTAPVHYGPLYLWRNTAWEIGSRGTGRNVAGAAHPSGKAIKQSRGSAPQARIYIVHNSIDIDQNDPNLVDFAGNSGGGSTQYEVFWIKNNIITCTRYIVDPQPNIAAYVEDYNFFATSSPTNGLRIDLLNNGTLTDYDNTSSALEFEDYRAATGEGANSNLVLAVTKQVNAADWLADVRAMWEDRDAGTLTLVIGAPAINRGTPIPNISDRAGVDYLGSAPDLGAFERE